MISIRRGDDPQSKLACLPATIREYARKVVGKQLAKVEVVWVFTSDDDLHHGIELAEGIARSRLEKYETANMRIIQKKGVFVFPIYPL